MIRLCLPSWLTYRPRRCPVCRGWYWGRRFMRCCNRVECMVQMILHDLDVQEHSEMWRAMRACHLPCSAVSVPSVPSCSTPECSP
jgi:hypothetical protein